NVGFFCSLLAPSDAILFQEGVSVKLRLPQMAALPVSWIQMLAGLALLSTIGGSLYQALHNERERERDAAVVAFLVTASGLTLVGIGSAFWGLIAGGVCYVVLNLIADRNRY
ncbi:benzoate/H(+) symporter BenE family transporter, partial [Shigella sonnei]|uniref:benzoate/H(+) symporter BenE family transporter n=25 Tax=Enterobacteriaceae TaxID=543 RepID=UPI0020921AE3